MSAEELAVIIGEFVSTEIEGVETVSYEHIEENRVNFFIIYENGKRISVEIKV